MLSCAAGWARDHSHVQLPRIVAEEKVPVQESFTDSERRNGDEGKAHERCDDEDAEETCASKTPSMRSNLPVGNN